MVTVVTHASCQQLPKVSKGEGEKWRISSGFENMVVGKESKASVSLRCCWFFSRLKKFFLNIVVKVKI